MNQSRHSETARLTSTPRFVSWKQSPDRSRQLSSRAEPRHRGPAWLQFAVAAALILGLVGAAYGGGMFSRFSGDRPTAIPAVLGSNSATATPSTTVAASDPVGFRGDAARTGIMPGPVPVGAPTLIWKNTSGGTRPGLLAADGGRVFSIVDTDGTGSTYPFVLKAIDLKTGSDLWSVGLDAANDAAPVGEDGFVYAETKYGLVALDATNGALVWSYSTGGYESGDTHGVYEPIGPVPAFANGTLYFTADDATIRAIDAKTGAEKWNVAIPGLGTRSYATDGPYASTSVAVAGGVIYGAGEGGRVFAVDAADGSSVWTFRVDGSIAQPPVVADGAVYLAAVNTADGRAGKAPGRLYGLDAKSGKQLWPSRSVSSSFAVSAANGIVFVASSLPDGTPLTAFDGATGKQTWTYDNAGFGFAPVLASGRLFFEGPDGSINAIDVASRTLVWSVFLNSLGEPIVVDGLLIASGNGGIYAIGGNGEAEAAANVDLSGYAPCTPPGTVPTKALTGKPAHAIDAETELKTRAGTPPFGEDGRVNYFTEYPQLLAENVPTGPAASKAQTEAILATFNAMGACSVRIDGQRLIQGFFTDDFFRRGVAKAGADGYSLTWQYQPEEKELAAMTTVVLDDGRVAALFQSTGPHFIVIFAQQDGHWMIDEFYVIVDQYNWSQLG